MKVKSRRPSGGTIIADVASLGEHRRRMESPDGYRPDACSSCGNATLHVHDYRQRKLRTADGPMQVVRLVRFACSDCGAVWRLLPKFICAGVRSTWRTVERVVRADPEPTSIPRRTTQRWRARFASPARLLVVVLATASAPWADRVVVATGHYGTRADLVAAFSNETGFTGHDALANLAEVVERIRPGTRLMSATGFVRCADQRTTVPPEMARPRFPAKGSNFAEPTPGAVPIPDFRAQSVGGNGNAGRLVSPQVVPLPELHAALEKCPTSQRR